MKRLTTPRALLLCAAVLAISGGCGPKAEKPAAAPVDDLADRMIRGRAAAQAFRPPGVTAALAFLDELADTTTALAVWVELRGSREGLLVGAWRGDATGDTTAVQVAGGTGLRALARAGEPGADLVRLAGAEAGQFHGTTDLEPPGDGRVRIWMVSPGGVRLREESVAALLAPDRVSTPFLQETRLFVEKALGDVVEFEASTSATMESLGVTPEHPATKLAAALGIDPKTLR
jgi:hypothetical protein